MLDRDTFDIIMGSLAGFKLYMIQLSINKNDAFIQAQTFALAAILLISFIHMIFAQLNRMSLYNSKIISLLIILLGTIGLILQLIIPPIDIIGFWSEILNGYSILSYLISAIIIILSVYIFQSDNLLTHN